MTPPARRLAQVLLVRPDLRFGGMLSIRAAICRVASSKSGLRAFAGQGHLSAFGGNHEDRATGRGALFKRRAVCNQTTRKEARRDIPKMAADNACYASGARAKRRESERFRRFAYADLVARDKVDLNIFWLNDDTLDDPDLLPPPEEVAAEAVENLETALERFRRVANALGRS
jgi:hypothetical protein